MNQQFNEHTTVTELAQHFAAQPIFDSNKNRFALELLQRNASAVSPLVLSAESAGQLALQCNTLTDFIAPYNTALLLQLCPQLLLSGTPLPLPADTTIIALAPSSVPSEELIAAIARIKKRGFRVALDVSLLTDAGDAAPALLALADILQLDVLGCDLDALQSYKAQFDRSGLTWLAARVETEAQFAVCKALGCNLFQGYFLANTLEVAGQKIEPSALKLAEIISCLFAEEPDINKLAQLLTDEPSIVMGMLKIANSPLYRKTREVSSVKEMVTRLGLELARKWILTYAVLGSTTPAAAITVLTRAHSAQRIAQQWQLDNNQCQQYFLAAVISGSDLLFGISNEMFLPHLNIAQAIQQALSLNSGQMADALAIVRAIERGSALKLPCSDSERLYSAYYNTALAEVQLRLAQAGY